MIRFTHLLLAAGLYVGAIIVFARVRLDYEVHGRLSGLVAVLQTGYFFIYMASSYAFLDSRLSQVNTDSALFFLALGLMTMGLLVVAYSMPILGRRSFGRQTGSLYTRGLYKFSRNPQLVGCACVLLGYILLWPSWTGFLWAGLWPVITHFMVQGEEQHLDRIFGEEYRAYCSRTPRYIGFWKRSNTGRRYL